MNRPKRGIVCEVIGLTLLGSLGGPLYDCPKEPFNRSEIRCTEPGQGSTGELDGTFFPNEENRTSAQTTFSTT